MNPRRLIGIVLLVAGVVLVIVGLNASHSVADQVSSTFTGRFTRETAIYLIGGGAIALLGLLMALFGARGRRA